MPDHRPERSPTGPPVISSAALLAGGRELVIRHGEDEYRLRITGNNKLILTK
ncbi:MAG: hemin uptake protein HemP [Acetobacteraceae bacterium]|nr:hemin uptake protein HemP [Acetobacteraceae bacterium]